VQEHVWSLQFADRIYCADEMKKKSVLSFFFCGGENEMKNHEVKLRHVRVIPR